MRILLYITLLCLLSAGLAYFVGSRPEMTRELLIAVDRFGITDAGKKERIRIAKINALPITYEEKQVLIKRTVFLNADINMVYLALGNPREVKQVDIDGEDKKATLMVYHFANDKRPTILRFENNKLTSAYKGSVLEVYSQSE